VKPAIYKKLEQLERIHAAARRAEEYCTAPSGVDVMQALLRGYAVAQLAGESRTETLARAAGISARELKDLLQERAHAADPAWERATKAPPGRS
jgi:hypothetical protein